MTPFKGWTTRSGIKLGHDLNNLVDALSHSFWLTWKFQRNSDVHFTHQLETLNKPTTRIPRKNGYFPYGFFQVSSKPTTRPEIFQGQNSPSLVGAQGKSRTTVLWVPKKHDTAVNQKTLGPNKSKESNKKNPSIPLE